MIADTYRELKSVAAEFLFMEKMIYMDWTCLLKAMYKKIVPLFIKKVLWREIAKIIHRARFHYDLHRIPAKEVYGIVTVKKNNLSITEQKLDKVIVCWLPIWIVGHFCTVYHYAYQMYLKRPSNRVFYVIVPDTMKSAVGQGVPNQYLYNKFTEILPSGINPETGWREYTQKHLSDIELLDVYDADKFYFNAAKQYFAGTWGELSIPFDQPSVIFSHEEKLVGQEKMSELGIRESFICIFARDSAYHSEKKDAPNQLRNFDIETFREVTEYFSTHYHMQTVRMGAKVDKTFSCSGCVDYATIGRSEFMDAYLFSRCEFYLGSSSGIECIARLFAKPIVGVDFSCVLPIDEPTMPYHLFIFVKWYDEKKQHYLTLREIIRLQLELKLRNPDEHGLIAFMNYVTTHDITVVRSTAQEILDVAEQMHAILQGSVQYTKEDEVLQQKYRRIIYEATKEHKNITGNFGRVGARWLRENAWFLE